MAVRSDVITNAFIICLCACFMLGHRIDARISMSETCQLHNEGYIADYECCQCYGYCKNGEVVARGKCPDGLLYDSRKAICNYANQTECLVSKADMCKGENAVLKADPENCNNYCYCNNGQTETGKCPTNQIYNQYTQRCVWASTFSGCVAASDCALVPDNKFIGYANTDDCSKFQRCQNHIGIPGKCADGYKFNPSNGMCDTFTTMNCPNNPIVTMPGEKPVNTTEVCSQYDTAKDGVQFFGDKVSCPGYVACTAKGKGVWQQCAWATHFDSSNGKCVIPYTVQCEFNRCKNINQSFMTAYNTGCTEYVSCSDQQSSKESSSCANVDPKFPFFSENLGGCVKDKPDQAICN